MERIIELKWNCNSCGSKGVLGRHKTCPECGSPREKGEMIMDGLDTDADGDVWRAAERALDVAVYRAVNLGVFRVVREAAKGDSEHPALLDFVRDAEERCRVPDPSSSGE